MSEFTNRTDAGRRLADVMAGQPIAAQLLLLALPRGGVPVAFEMARRSGLPMDVLIARTIGAPGHPECGIGAVVDGREPHVFIDEQSARHFRIPPGYLDTERHHQLAEIERRHRMYFGEDDAESHDYRGRNVMLVDDGIADGATVRACIQALRQAGVGSISLAVPVAEAELLEELRHEVDAVICLHVPRRFDVVGAYYDDFGETSDQEIVRMLRDAGRLDRMLH